MYKNVRNVNSKNLNKHINEVNVCGSVHHAFVVKIIGPLSGRHDAEQQDSDYLQLHTTHTDRTTLLRTNSLTKCARLSVAIHSTCTPDDGWDCHPKRVE